MASHGQILKEMIEVFKEVSGIPIGAPEGNGWHPMSDSLKQILKSLSSWVAPPEDPIGIP